METCANYTTGDALFFSSDERRWVTKIRKLAEQYPDEVQIIKQPEDNDGCIYAKLPVCYLKIQHPKVMNYTDEQRKAMADRMRNIAHS